LLGIAEEVTRIAAQKLAMRLEVRETWMQSEDHPWILQIPYTRYLQSWRFKPFGLSKA
jgi:hypothetical protein